MLLLFSISFPSFLLSTLVSLFLTILNFFIFMNDSNTVSKSIFKSKSKSRSRSESFSLNFL